MSWDTSLLPEQKRAASHMGRHACLRAGPGTGKTLTLARRIVFLTVEKEVPPAQILVLTFTRAAVRELRDRIKADLKPYGIDLPRISTLHSFALRQLLRNSEAVKSIPTPIRIADDWEEDNIIRQDLSAILNVGLRDVKKRFNQLSSDWCTLAETGPDPKFLGAWREHSRLYGYTLRIQLVYELKKALEQVPGFQLEHSFKYLLVDEYQDLNPCDLAVIKKLSDQGIEVFAAGDDDQSIYGFRFAHPDGIRSFEKDYDPSKLLDLRYCKRCDKRIIDISQFVVKLDPRRIDKPLLPMPDSPQGEVHLLLSQDQHEEAESVAMISQFYINSGAYRPADILVLLRGDHQRCFSEVLINALSNRGIAAASTTDYIGPLDTSDGREFLSFLRLYVNQEDDFAWRTLIELRKNRIGPSILSAVHEFALKNGLRFSQALSQVRASPQSVPRWGNLLSSEINSIAERIQQLRDLNGDSNEIGIIPIIAGNVVTDPTHRQQIITYLNELIETYQAETISDLFSAISVSVDDQEQEIDMDKINILTMHRAKGLTADVVFLIGAEDEYMPGRQVGEEEWDARRLLYVSLTRARHVLLITQCQRRVGNQQYTGRATGQHRQLSRFLHDYPIVAESALAFAASLARPLQLLPTLTTPVEDLDFCFMDLETTGLDPTKDRVCEIALVKTRLNTKDKEKRLVFSTLINPTCPIPQEVSKIHGITDETVRQSPMFHEFADRIMQFIQGCVLVSHNNAGFDLPFLTAELLRSGKIPPQNTCLCTLRLSQRNFTFPDNKLETICLTLGVDLDKKHRAFSDAQAIERVFVRFVNHFGKEHRVTLGDLITLQGGQIEIPKMRIR